MAKDFIKTWNGRRLADWGCSVSAEFKSFQRAMRNEIKRLAEQEGATLAAYSCGHYDMSGFVERDGLYVYFCYSNIDRCKVSLTPDGGWLSAFYMRTAAHIKDYHGGPNNNVAFSEFSETLRRLFKELERKREMANAASIDTGVVMAERLRQELLKLKAA